MIGVIAHAVDAAGASQQQPQPETQGESVDERDADAGVDDRPEEVVLGAVGRPNGRDQIVHGSHFRSGARSRGRRARRARVVAGGRGRRMRRRARTRSASVRPGRATEGPRRQPAVGRRATKERVTPARTRNALSIKVGWIMVTSFRLRSRVRRYSRGTANVKRIPRNAGSSGVSSISIGGSAGRRGGERRSFRYRDALIRRTTPCI